MTALTILIVDDHPLVRDALRHAALKAAPGAAVQCVGSMADAETALNEDRGADLVMLDLDLPDASGLTGLLRLRKNPAARRIMVVSASDADDVVRRARAAGAGGYASKSAELSGLVEAITAALEDRGWDGHPELTADDRADEAAELTPAQLRVLEGLMAGRLNKQIAFDMNISEATVKAHVTAVFRKLGVRNRTQAVIAAQSLHLSKASA